VADAQSGDRSIEPVNGTKEERDGLAAAPEDEHDHALADARTRSDGDQTAADSDQAAADSDQAAADSDQAAADSDQAAADSDQAAADSDQTAADSDQAAADSDLAHGGDPSVYAFTRDLRGRGLQARQQGARLRVEAAAARDAVARARDEVASERDQAAEQHDRELAARDAAWRHHERALTGAEVVLRAAENRRRAAADRAAAAQGRARAAADREQAAEDREQAARDRLQAAIDRDELLHRLAIAETDPLTGTRTRAAGLEDLEHEIDRARRTMDSLVVAFVDIVGLKAVNDTHGHAAGDTLLQSAVRGIRGHLRSYDLIVRLGGDEFLSVMSGTTIEDAHQRFAAIQAALRGEPQRCEIKVGFAALAPQDSAAALINRADAELPISRRR
jgi:diguanylate cyclase (GGDEF)-like protein